jgi:enoyl-CoA hydratase/carnithine racemase
MVEPSFSSGSSATASPGPRSGLNRPAKGNALTMAMIDRLGEITDDIARDRDARAVVLRSAGRFFCTGGDIEAWGRPVAPRHGT